MVGVFFGTLAPMHREHLYRIISSSLVYDKIIVIVSGFTNDRGEQNGMPLIKRYAAVEKTFSTNDNIEVVMINEDNIPQMPAGWTEWLELVNKSIENRSDVCFITSEASYATELEKRGYHVDVAERVGFISGTKIRNKPFIYWDYIGVEFKKFFQKTLLVSLTKEQLLLLKQVYGNIISIIFGGDQQVVGCLESSKIIITTIETADAINLQEKDFTYVKNEIDILLELM